MNRIKQKLQNAVNRFFHIRGMKYILVVIVSIVYIGFIDDDSVWQHLRNKQRINELQSEIKMFTDQYNHDQSQIHMLDSDPKAIEKIARERYFMKADDEDIFVLSDDKRTHEFINDDETAE